MGNFWAGTGVFCGPFESSRAFVETIALTNCVEYFSETKRDVLNRRRSLRLFNAVVSLDSAVDYLWHDRGHPVPLQVFLDELAREEPALKELRELSNALKHCTRGRQDKKGFKIDDRKRHAGEVVPMNLKVDVGADASGEPAVTLTISSDLLEEAHSVLERAFRFWQARAQEP